MNRPIIFGYQLLTGISDFSTGALLMIAPAFDAAADALAHAV